MSSYHLPPHLTRKVVIEAKNRSKTPQDLVREIVAEKLAYVVVPGIDDAVRCLDPECKQRVFGRGLCMRTYRRARYFVAQGILCEEWLVRHGRMLPARGCTTSDYAVEAETLATLPGDLPDIMAETTWLFGFPQAQAERARLREEASRA